MSSSHKLIFFLKGGATGLLAPSLSLIFLSRGAALSSLSLCIAVYAFAVVFLELPSGILADRYGKKSVFLFSSLLHIVSFSLMAFSDSLFLLLPACFLYGCAAAFASGSIEALEIQSALHRDPSSLIRINNQLAVLDGTGLAFGSLLSGFFLGFESGIDLLLFTIPIIHGLILLLSALFFHEDIKATVRPSSRTDISSIFQPLADLHSAPFLILVCSIPFGASLATVETYWSPLFLSLVPAKELSWMIGIINCLGYVSVSAGSALCQYFLDRRKDPAMRSSLLWKGYFFLRIMFFITITLMSLFTIRKRPFSVLLFILIFMGIYMLAGAGSLCESTLFHTSVPERHRTASLSILSLMLRSGGLFMGPLSLVHFPILKEASIWITVPLFSVLWTCLFFRKKFFEIF